MRTLDRYVGAQFLRNLAVVLAVLVTLYGLIEFIERVDDFIENRAALLHYLRYPLYNLPFMLEQALPMGVLLAAFVTIGQLSRTSQITALRSCGIGLWQITRPLFVCGALLCVCVLLSGAWLSPWSAREARYILATEVKGGQQAKPITESLYFRDRQRIISVTQSFPERGEVTGLSLLEFDQGFRLTRRLEAASARYREGTSWLLTGVVDRRFEPQTQAITTFARHAELILELGRKPQEMTEIWYKPQEMSLRDLRQLADRLAAEGGDPLRYHAEWHQRLARAAVPVLMVLLGVPFALHRGRKASVALGIGVSLAAFSGYFACQAVAMALGTAGLLPLPVAAWAANLLLLLIGSWLFLTLDS